MSSLLDQRVVRSSPSVRSLSALQLGLHWFLEGGGGADRMYADLVRAIAEHGVQCRGLVAGSERAAAESRGVVRAFAPANISILRRWRALRAAVRYELIEHPPDLAVSHFAMYAFPVQGIIRRRGIPLVVHFHGPCAGESKAEGAGRIRVAAKAALERAVYGQAKRLIVLSDAFGKILARDYAIPADLIRTVPPGIDTARFRSELSRSKAREKLGWPTDRPIVLAVRRLVQRMGLENLIDAAARVRQELPDLLIQIAGKGPLAEALQKKIKALGLENHVRLLGFVPDDDLPAAYAAADLTVVPTVALEGFGLIVVESMSAGTPVLVTPVGGLPEAVRDLSSALVIEGMDAVAIARAMADVLRGRLTLPSAEECQTFAKEKYDWSVVAPQIRVVYEEAM